MHNINQVWGNRHPVITPIKIMANMFVTIEKALNEFKPEITHRPKFYPQEKWTKKLELEFYLKTTLDLWEYCPENYESPMWCCITDCGYVVGVTLMASWYDEDSDMYYLDEVYTYRFTTIQRSLARALVR